MTAALFLLGNIAYQEHTGESLNNPLLYLDSWKRQDELFPVFSDIARTYLHLYLKQVWLFFVH